SPSRLPATCRPYRAARRRRQSRARVRGKARPLNALVVALFVLVSSLHSQLGLQVVIEDYVHDPRVQRTAVRLAGFAHVVIAAAGVLAVIRVAGGGAT
ncbi:MAG TPA: hypothetical protein VIH25_12640, partial [Steroidobacteraceae bacterium]